MAKKINTSIWLTQKELAKRLNVKIQTVHNWVQRGKIDTLEYEFIPGQKIVLVNKNTISVDNQRLGRYAEK
jgi:excisionase family DNA binding protein